MKFSTKSRYGLRIMLELALFYNKKLLQVKDIAKKENIPEKYLEQILSVLRTAGLIKSIRGARGGYFLAKEPNKITVYDVVSKLEGSLYPVDCAEDEKLCDRIHQCVTVGIWRKVGDIVIDFMRSMTLEDLVKQYQEKNGAVDFYI